MSDFFCDPDSVLVFDFDGVILDSASLKREAFAALYDDQPEPLRRAVRAYLGRRGGQPREVKFRHIEAQILGRPADEASIEALCRRFKAGVEQRILAAPAIPGALAFLESHRGRLPIYLLSATPEHELREIVARRDLAGHFDEVIGSPPDKVTGLGQLLNRHGLRAPSTVMVGDSYNDYRAARSNATGFVGVTADPAASPFPTDVVTTLDLRGLEAALASWYRQT
ncbi:HAD family hydrolase [Halomonas getboli]|uniref:HAD family hydrolase n=1 Tax=Halomonas getboli TaxID=2935862 RepID=UPI001FFF1060|nr:haloacid dehalogenase-like hydrolase [Halomonas getboli]